MQAKKFMDGTCRVVCVSASCELLLCTYNAIRFGDKHMYYMISYTSSFSSLASLSLHLETNKNMEITFHVIIEGLLVPDEVMIKMVFATTQSASATGQSLLLDGFPRTLSQAQSLDNTLTINHVINLCIPNEIIVERISDRWIHPASGRVYSYSYRPPKVHGIDDETGEQLVQRDDDKPASVMRRLEKYEEATRPLVDYYRDKGVLQTFKGTMSDVIYVDVKRWLEEKLAGDDDEEDEKEMKG